MASPGCRRNAKGLRRRQRLAKAKTRKARDRPTGIDDFDKAVDAIVGELIRQPTPCALYHYTTLAAARKILTSQQFWATAHYSMKDPAEIDSAGEVIRTVASRLRAGADGDDVTLLDMFLENYGRWRSSKVFDSFLVCFSEARDKASQWQAYGDRGRGVCLALQVIAEPTPPYDFPVGGRALLKVNYNAESWARLVEKCFRRILSLRRRYCSTASHSERRRALVLAGVGLQRIAAITETIDKRESYASEEEWRVVALARGGAQCQHRDDGRAYLPLRLRIDQRPLLLAEVIVGPDAPQDAESEVRKILSDAAYPHEHAPLPPIVRSSHRVGTMTARGDADGVPLQ